MKTLKERLADAGYDNTFVYDKCDEAFIGVTHNERAVYDASLIKEDLSNVEVPEGMEAPLVVEKVDFNKLPDDVLVLDPHDLNKAIVYISDDNRAVYDHDLLIDAFMETEGWDYEEAEDWYSVNTERSLPYYPGSPYILFNIDYMD